MGAQVDYDKSDAFRRTSITGKNICQGDVVGVSVLSIHQEDIMNLLGNGHSDEIDKFKDIKYTLDDSAILIDDASICMVVEVIDVIHLEGIEEDNPCLCSNQII